MRTVLWTGIAFVWAIAFSQTHADSPTPIQVFPKEIRLDGPYDTAQLVVVSADSQGQLRNNSDCLNDAAQFASSAPAIVTVSSTGAIRAHANGSAVITIVHDKGKSEVPVQVSNYDSTVADFLKDVRPVFNKAGCAAAACHASQHGQGGFKMSVFGYDPVADYEAIAVSTRGRRINPAAPDASLLLEKACMREAHGGGLRLDSKSLEYRTVKDWISAGAPFKNRELAVEKLEVFPLERVGTKGYKQQLRVIATYNDQTQRDVTNMALYDAIDSAVVSVNRTGLVETVSEGQTSVMIRYDGQVAVSTFAVPYSQENFLADWKSNNYIDVLSADKFKDLGLEPSPVCDDATFVRRAFLDAIGSLPEPEEVTRFLESKDPRKRELLIDQLLGLTGNPELDIYNERYSALWTLRWSDLIRNDSSVLGAQGMWALHNWIRQSFRDNVPFDQFVRELITAKGSIYSNGPANYFRVHADSSALTEATSQLFLGVRLECAKCHQHPFESISQADYYSMAAFFSRVGTKTSEEFGLFGRESVVMVRPTGEVSHPKSGKRMSPTPLDGESIDHPLDRRIPLAQWLTSKDNPYFARAIVNRYTNYLLGYGLVEPVDDMRSTNPPSNAALMDALAKDFMDHNYDLKHLVRTIMQSRLYSLSSQPTPRNIADRRFHSYYYARRLTAEPLLDAIDRATGTKTKFRSLPSGTLAIELPDAEYPDYFLNTFAKPRRVSVCECERSPDANLAQALHTLNGDTLANKIASKDGRIAKLMAAKKSHEEIVNELYLATLCRPATQEELAASQEFLKSSPSPTECYQDLLWALINSKHFLFVH